MPDISMCTNDLCPKAKECWRHEAEPSEWQSYTCFNYMVTEKGVECVHFWAMYEIKTTNNTKSTDS